MCFTDNSNDTRSVEREKARQRDQQSAIDSINRLFGKEGGAAPNREDYMTINRAPAQYKQDMPTESKNADPNNLEQLKVFDEAGYNRALADYEAGNKTAAENKAAREKLYDGLREDINKYYGNQLNEQRTNAERGSRFDLARRGVTGGGAAIDEEADLLKRYNQQVLKIGNQADASVRDARSADERARGKLIDRVSAGGSADAAIQSAQSDLDVSLNTIRDNALGQSLANIFKSYAPVVRENNRTTGYINALRAPSLPRSYFGSTS